MFETTYCQNSLLNPNASSPTAKSTSPVSRTAFRPYLSPMRPAGIWNASIVPQNAASTTAMRNMLSRFS
jgi:hypothetical protein